MKSTHLLQKLFAPLENCEAATLQLCKQLGVHVTKTTLKKQLEEHPDYPSLLAVSDVLNNTGIENVSLRAETRQLKEFPVPMLAQVRINGEKLFTLIYNIDEDNIHYSHPVSNKAIRQTSDEFSPIFTGYVLLAEASEQAGEKDYPEHLKEEKRLWLTKLSAAGIIPLFVLIACLFTLFHTGAASIAAVIYTLITLSGTIVSILLLWYEVDQYNPALQQICSAGKKTNCGAIVHSKASKIFGISWSVIGFTYFAGSLISLLITGIYRLPTLFVLSWLNVLALPYIVFSIYYQARIAKQWCVLCLTVQALLALQFVTALSGKFHTSAAIDSINTDSVLTFALSFIIPFIAVSLLLPALRAAKESKQHKTELQRLKHNPQIFEALLAKQKAITEPTEGLGITIGKPGAKYKLIKVCNPYCGPCAKAHPAIEELVENNPEVQVQIIFTATGDEQDRKTPPTKHLLAIAGKNDEVQIKHALDDWYLAEKKDYNAFAEKYPMNGELKQQDNKIKAMAEWCNKTEIAFTPTFFVNGYQLPEQYSVNDLKYFLSV